MGTVSLVLAACLTTSGLPYDGNMLVDNVDLIEINHCYDDNGQLVFDQLLFYDWSPERGHYDLRDWRLLKSPLQVPRRNHESGGFVTVWRDGKTMRKVHAKTIRESWTQYDPEIIEQEFLPKDKRRSFPKLLVRRQSVTPEGGRTADQRASEQSGRAAVR